jgi:hypothetical protein
MLPTASDPVAECSHGKACAYREGRPGQTALGAISR